MNRFYILCSFSSSHPFNVWIETSFQRFKCIQLKFFRRNEHIVFKWFHKISNYLNVLQVKYLLQMKNTWNEIVETGVPFSQCERTFFASKWKKNHIPMQIKYNLNTILPLPHKLNVQLNGFWSSWIGIVKCIQRENLSRTSAKTSAFDIAFHFSVQRVPDPSVHCSGCIWCEEVNNVNCHISVNKYQIFHSFCSQQKADWIFHFECIQGFFGSLKYAQNRNLWLFWRIPFFKHNLRHKGSFFHRKKFRPISIFKSIFNPTFIFYLRIS